MTAIPARKRTTRTTPERPANPRRLGDASLCRLCDGLGHRAWEARRRGWPRRLGQVRAALAEVLCELDRRIERDAEVAHKDDAGIVGNSPDGDRT